MTLDPAKANELVTNLREAREPSAVAVHADAALNFLLKQLEELRGLANGYPRNPIGGDVWMDGQALTVACDALSEALAGRDEAARRELATRLAAGMACQVMAHYPEEIFPRVVRNARCREAINQVEAAIGAYESVVGDFMELGLDETLEDGEPAETAERSILEAMREALERLADLQPERTGERQVLLRKVRLRLGTMPE